MHPDPVFLAGIVAVLAPTVPRLLFDFIRVRSKVHG